MASNPGDKEFNELLSASVELAKEIRERWNIGITAAEYRFFQAAVDYSAFVTDKVVQLEGKKGDGVH